MNADVEGCEETHEDFMKNVVSLGGGVRKTVREILDEGMRNDFPEWRTRQYSIPSAEDAAAHPTANLIPDAEGKEIYLKRILVKYLGNCKKGTKLHCNLVICSP